MCRLPCSWILDCTWGAARAAQVEGAFTVLDEVACSGRSSAQRRARLVLERLQDLPLLM